MFRSVTSALLCAVALSALGCSSNNNLGSSQGLTPGLQTDGGVDGGGGGTLPTNPMTTAGIADLILKAKKDLSPFVLGAVRNYNPNSGPAYAAKLYGNKTTLYDVLWTTDIETNLKAPCKDTYGRDVDGSVHSKNPNAICISAYSISKKVERRIARTEVLALILHELSHKLGLDEREATEFQRDVAEQISHGTTDSSAKNFFERNDSALGSLNAVLQFSMQKNQDVTAKTYSEQLDALERYLAAASKPFDANYSLMTKSEYNYYGVLLIRVQVAIAYLRSLSGSEDSKAAKDILKRIFGSASQVKISDFDESYEMDKDMIAEFGNEVVVLPQDIHEANAQLGDFLKSVVRLMEINEMLDKGLRPPPASMPSDTVSP